MFRFALLTPLRTRILAVIAAGVVFAQLHGNTQAANGDSTGALVLNQVSSGHGPSKTYITSNAVKICFSDMNGFLLATGPAWKVVLVNVDEKLIYEASYADFMAHKIRRSYLGGWDSAHEIPVKKLRKTNYAGQDCELFGFPENFHPANWRRYPNLFAIPADKTPKPVCFIISKWFATPAVIAVPMAFKWINPANGVAVSENIKTRKLGSSLFGEYFDPLDCKSVSKEIVVANFFEYPKSYKHVKSELDLFSSRGRTMMMEDVYKDAAEPLSIRKH